jgi:Rod binding domain-containing protein
MAAITEMASQAVIPASLLMDSAKIDGLDKNKDPQKAAKQVEQVFLGELLRVMLDNTEVGKGQMVSGYMPLVTSEVAKALSNRGIGFHEFLMRSPQFSNTVTKHKTIVNTDKSVENDSAGDKTAGELRMPVRGGISSAYGSVSRAK